MLDSLLPARLIPALCRRRKLGKTYSLKRGLNWFTFSARLVADEAGVVGAAPQQVIEPERNKRALHPQDSDA